MNIGGIERWTSHFQSIVRHEKDTIQITLCVNLWGRKRFRVVHWALEYAQDRTCDIGWCLNSHKHRKPTLGTYWKLPGIEFAQSDFLLIVISKVVILFNIFIQIFISVFTHVFIYLSIRLYIYLYIYPHDYFIIYLPMFLFIYLCTDTLQRYHQYIYIYVYIYIYIFIYQSIKQSFI